MAKTACRYCGGWTNDDWRGNCAACGGPRTIADIEYPDYYRDWPRTKPDIQICVTDSYSAKITEFSRAIDEMNDAIGKAMLPAIDTMLPALERYAAAFAEATHG